MSKLPYNYNIRSSHSPYLLSGFSKNQLFISNSIPNPSHFDNLNLQLNISLIFFAEKTMISIWFYWNASQITLYLFYPFVYERSPHAYSAQWRFSFAYFHNPHRIIIWVVFDPSYHFYCNRSILCLCILLGIYRFACTVSTPFSPLSVQRGSQIPQTPIRHLA